MIKGFIDSIRYESLYKKQAALRRQIIRKMYNDQISEADWQHLATVLKTGGYKNPSGQELTVQEIKAEHAKMVLLDIQLDEP